VRYGRVISCAVRKRISQYRPGPERDCNPDAGITVTQALLTRRIHCPYCAEPMHIQLDLSAGDQEYIEDCQVCCQPILIRYAVEGIQLLSIDVSCSN
jgi:hypothetical protein